MLALGIDPGFRNTGVCIVDIDDPMKVIAMRMIITKKNKVESSVDDNIQRAFEIHDALTALRLEFPAIGLVCAESMSYPPDASSAAKISMCWGVIAGFIRKNMLLFFQTSPQRIKEVVAGNSSASKEEVQRAVCCKFEGQQLDLLHPKVASSLEEHLYDAVAAVLAAASTPGFRLIQRSR